MVSNIQKYADDNLEGNFNMAVRMLTSKGLSDDFNHKEVSNEKGKINYREFYEQSEREKKALRMKLAEANETINANLEYYGDQMISLNAQVAMLKQQLKTKGYN